MNTHLTDYKREMVTLHLKFRNEENDVLADMKFLKIFDDNEQLIMERRKEFEDNIDIAKTMEICAQLCRELEDSQTSDDRAVINIQQEQDPYQHVMSNPHSIANLDLRQASLSKLGAVVKTKDNIMDRQQFNDFMRLANDKQYELLQHCIHLNLTENPESLKLFLTGPAGCGKTFTVKLVMEIFNRFSPTDGYLNAYIACATTGKAAVALDGLTYHTALSISPTRYYPLSQEKQALYQTLFKYVKIVVIDEISMMGAEMLERIDRRLKEIKGRPDLLFGGVHIIFIGDLRQLPAVRQTAIYKQKMQTIDSGQVWRQINFYELTDVMRQENELFSSALTNIGNGQLLNAEQLELIESRFVTKEDADRLCPSGIRLFFENDDVDAYNNEICRSCENAFTSVAVDTLIGCGDDFEKERAARVALHQKSSIDTGGLPYHITFALNKPYIITTNIDVADGLANGEVGELVHVELDDKNNILRVWIIFPKSVGIKARSKHAQYGMKLGISTQATPIGLRNATFPVYKNKSHRHIQVKRRRFPLKAACAMTIHKSQGGTYDSIVYTYKRGHSQSLVYVALSRVTSPQGLFIIPANDKKIFYHGRREDDTMAELRTEFERLSTVCLQTCDQTIVEKMNLAEMTIFSFNCQSLNAHAKDLRGNVLNKSDFLLLSETWIENDKHVEIHNFLCVVQYKRPGVRAGGVAIYQNTQKLQHVVTNHTDIYTRNDALISTQSSSVGDLCAAECKMHNGKTVIMVSVYISPGKSIGDITDFIHHVLLPYTEGGAKLLNKNYHEIPMIIAGDFNVNFANEESLPLIDFFRNVSNLEIATNRNIGTTRHGTTIDAVFSRFIDNLSTNIYISHFSYHKPIVTVIKNTVSINDSDK